MKWNTVKSDKGIIATAELENNNHKKLNLTYKNPRSFYFETEEGQKRFLRLRRKGFFTPGLFLINEYGADLSSFTTDGQHQYISVDEKRYLLEFKNQNTEVEIKDIKTNENIAVCTLDHQATADPDANYGMLMVLCLYTLRSAEGNTLN